MEHELPPCSRQTASCQVPVSNLIRRQHRQLLGEREELGPAHEQLQAHILRARAKHVARPADDAGGGDGDRAVRVPLHNTKRPRVTTVLSVHLVAPLRGNP